MPLSQAQIDEILKTAKREPASSTNPIWRGIELASRPGEAALAGVRGLFGGDVPSPWDVMTGTADFTGRDLVESIYGDTDSGWATATGVVADVLNPFDPLNYVGIGGLTKVGKAAKIAGRLDPSPAVGLAKSWGEQAAKGERGLLNFANVQVPVPGQSMALDALQRLGNGFMGSDTGKALSRMFGGKAGAIDSAMMQNPIEGEIAKQAEARATAVARHAGAPLSAQIDALMAKSSNAERVLIGNLMEAGRKGGESFQAAVQDFVQPGTKGFERRTEIAKLIEEFYPKRKGAASYLDGHGIDQYARADDPFLSHVFKPNPLAPRDKVQELVTGPVGRQVLLGAKGSPEDNFINKGLVSASIQTPMARMLDEEGQAKWLVGETIDGKEYKGADWYEKMEEVAPGFKVEFLRKHRRTIADLNADPVIAALGKFEDDAGSVLNAMRGELEETIKWDSLVTDLADQGIAVKWDDALHKEGFIRVNQGRWAKENVAIPEIYNTALKKIEEINNPSIDAATLGQQLTEMLPKQLQNLGLLAWMKDLMIWGGGPFAYLNRNVASAVHKNRLEGINMINAPRLYGGAAKMLGDVFGDTGRLLNPLSTLDETGEGIAKEAVWESKNHVEYSVKRLFEEYMHGNFHGGGSPDAELMQRAMNGSAAVRQKIFGKFHKANMRAEMFVRLPLMLKKIEDTEDVALALGKTLPQRVEEMAVEPKRAGTFFDVAMTNAKEAVINAHFDYTDLTPAEIKIRDTLVPFYSWWKKNLVHETINVIQKPGKYMPYLRAYQASFENRDMTQADLPEWAQRAFAMPVDPGVDDKIQWMDFTGFLPMMDLFEAGVTGATITGMVDPAPGRTRIADFMRYMAIRGNPFLVTPIEQAFQKSLFTGRDFKSDQPEDFLGMAISAPTRHLVNNLRPLTEFDRLNPFNIFGAERKHRNEAEGSKRALRFFTGVKSYGADDDIASMSEKTRKKRINTYVRNANEARAEGDEERYEFYMDRAKQLRGD